MFGGFDRGDLLRRMITQTGTIAVNSGNATGQSTLTTPIDRTLPHFILWLGSLQGNDEIVLTGMSANDKVDATRGTTEAVNGTAYYSVTGVPA